MKEKHRLKLDALKQTQDIAGVVHLFEKFIKKASGITNLFFKGIGNIFPAVH